MLKRKPEVFAPTDGFLYVMEDLAGRTTRGVDFSGVDGLCELYGLPYRRMRISSRDVELSDATGDELTLKVEVRKAPDLAPDLDVLCDGAMYDLTRVEDRGATCWLWLSEIATDGTCDLVSSTVTYDELAIEDVVETSQPVYVRKATLSTKRVNASGVDGLRPSVTLRLRACDYDGERTVMRGGVTYSVMSSEGHGRWVDLACSERGSDRG